MEENEKTRKEILDEIIDRINKKLDEMSNRLDKLIEVIKNE